MTDAFTCAMSMTHDDGGLPWAHLRAKISSYPAQSTVGELSLLGFLSRCVLAQKPRATPRSKSTIFSHDVLRPYTLHLPPSPVLSLKPDGTYQHRSTSHTRSGVRLDMSLMA